MKRILKRLLNWLFGEEVTQPTCKDIRSEDDIAALERRYKERGLML